MSLYSYDEICEGCKHAVFMKGKVRESFDYCTKGAEKKVSHGDGSCPVRAPKGGSET